MATDVSRQMKTRIWFFVESESRPIEGSNESGVPYRKVLTLGVTQDDKSAIRAAVNQLYFEGRLKIYNSQERIGAPGDPIEYVCRP